MYLFAMVYRKRIRHGEGGITEAEGNKNIRKSKEHRYNAGYMRFNWVWIKEAAK